MVFSTLHDHSPPLSGSRCMTRLHPSFQVPATLPLKTKWPSLLYMITGSLFLGFCSRNHLIPSFWVPTALHLFQGFRGCNLKKELQQSKAVTSPSLLPSCLQGPAASRKPYPGLASTPLFLGSCHSTPLAGFPQPQTGKEMQQSRPVVARPSSLPYPLQSLAGCKP
eukprot:c22854_g1_i1 orf=598-1095(+)